MCAGDKREVLQPWRVVLNAEQNGMTYQQGHVWSDRPCAGRGETPVRTKVVTMGFVGAEGCGHGFTLTEGGEGILVEGLEAARSMLFPGRRRRTA